MHRHALALVTLDLLAGCPARPVAGPQAKPSGPLISTAERSKWTRTGRYDEAVTLCHHFALTYQGVRCFELGETAEGRTIVELAILRAPGKPTILVQGGIHAGEIDGKDAGFWFVRDLLDGKVAPGALDAVNVLFIPVINPDGHERFGPNNRPNQRGPEEMGFRTNAQRINLNRDYLKAETGEIQIELSQVRKFDPVVFVDLHVTDGAKFQHDIAVLVSPVAPRDDQLDETAAGLSKHLQERLTTLGHLPVPFYPSYVEEMPESGFAIGEAPPRFSQGYAALRSRIGILVETHSWHTYPERVQATYHALQALLERATTDAASWRAAADDATRADEKLAGHDLTLVFDNNEHTTPIEFRGYAYEKRPSDISGGTWLYYDETKPQIWNVPLRDELVPTVTTRVPAEGYIVDGGFAVLVQPSLIRHGIHFTRIAGQPTVQVETFRATKVTYDPPYEGRTRAKLEGAWAKEIRTLDQGAIFVPTQQANARVVVHLLDPAGPDSLAQWGIFASAFEKKEYMEPYVAEEVARDMISKNPALRAEFDAAVAADPDMAKSPDKRLEWFYRRHPSWDERVNLLPVYRSDLPLH